MSYQGYCITVTEIAALTIGFIFGVGRVGGSGIVVWMLGGVASGLFLSLIQYAKRDYYYPRDHRRLGMRWNLPLMVVFLSVIIVFTATHSESGVTNVGLAGAGASVVALALIVLVWRANKASLERDGFTW